MPVKKYQVKFSETGGKKLESQTKRVNSGLKSMATTALKAGGAFFAAQGLIRGIGSTIELFGEQEQAEKQLQVALGRTSNALLDQAKALQQVSTFGDETIIRAQALIAAFVDDEDQIKAATKATLDLAAAKGMDLNTAADLVSKTLGSTTNALSRYGITVEGAVGSSERLSALTSEISDKFGGQAAAAAGTMAGSIEQMKNAVGDAAEAVGGLLAPAIITISGFFKSAAEAASEFFGIFAEDQGEFNPVADIKSINDQLDINASKLQAVEVMLNNTWDADHLAQLTASRDILATNNEQLETQRNILISLLPEITELNIKKDDSNKLELKSVETTGKSIETYRKLSNEKHKMIVQELKDAALSGQSAGEAMRSAVRAEAMEAAAGLVSSILKTIPFPLNIGLAAGAGIIASGLIDKAVGAIPKFAEGVDMVTSGPQLFLAGDNTGGQERVQVTPISSPNINGPQTGGNGITLNFNGDVYGMDDFREKVTEVFALNNQGIA